MSCDHELANVWARCSGKNASYITMAVSVSTLPTLSLVSLRFPGVSSFSSIKERATRSLLIVRPPCWIQISRQNCMLLRLRMSRYAYAYRTCKHACAYAYVCVVRVNQALMLSN